MAPSPTTIAQTRARLREAMPVARQWAYFDHAAVAPISEPAAAALRAWAQEAVEQGDTCWPNWAAQLKETRIAAARLIGAEPDQIALLPNTTCGINLVAEGLDWRAGDNVVTLDDEFPSNLYPWMHLAEWGVETRRVATNDGRVDLDQLADHCDQRTRVVSVSWIGYANGCRRDLDAIAQIAHRSDAIFFVDAIQGLGAFPLDVSKTSIDCLAADGHKWMLGPEGAGIAYLRPACLARLRPTGVGWNSVIHAADFSRIELNLKKSAARYEGGSHNLAGFLALGASLRLLLELGIGQLAEAILEFNDRAQLRLVELGAVIHSPWEPEQRSGIVSFEMPGQEPTRLQRHCQEQGVALNCRAGRLRISPHAYNDEQDLSRLVDALRVQQ